MARDDLLFELHKQTTQSPTDRNVSGVFGSIHAHTLILCKFWKYVFISLSEI